MVDSLQPPAAPEHPSWRRHHGDEVCDEFAWMKDQESADFLAGDTPTLVVADPRHALEAARAMRQPGDIILLTGSTYMIEQALNADPHLRTLGASFGWRMEQPNEATGTLNITLPQPPPPLR